MAPFRSHYQIEDITEESDVQSPKAQNQKAQDWIGHNSCLTCWQNWMQGAQNYEKPAISSSSQGSVVLTFSIRVMGKVTYTASWEEP